MPANATTVPDLTPLPGQSDADIEAWIKWKYPAGPDSKTARTYAGELYRTRPSRDDDPKGESEWYGLLTDGQRKILAESKQQKDADPVVKAARKAARKADPEYQRQLVQKRVEYATKIQDEEGRHVRAYRKGVMADTKKSERKARNEQRRARIREALSLRRNPFDVYKFDGCDVSAETDLRNTINHIVCRQLLKNGEFDPQCDPVIDAEIVPLADDIDLSDEEMNKMIAGAVETLRTAGAIRRSGGKVFLHRDIEKAHDDLEMSSNPFFAMF
ncbi:hypothetical protein RM190_21095 [Paracoccus sp. CPCC 101403]|uniref:Uncharacterized protein n=1 Tax=Paracoccus broussonetiae TaxID=3075834 RepID=A0ABU3EJW7_9RHOB|nr:hypothetical protein [Paracoccus sp. CPCC 101403]MDT1064371.1 hypothetical protein [Paracoccus sp. CPCC 101403]